MKRNGMSSSTRILFTACLVVGGGVARAEGQPAAERITLEDALRRAVAGNPELQRARAEVRSGRALRLAAEGQFDVLLGGAGTFSRTSTPRSSSACQIAWASANSPKKTKFASESGTVSPSPRSQGTRRSRSCRRARTVASGSSARASAARATAWVTADRW